MRQVLIVGHAEAVPATKKRKTAPAPVETLPKSINETNGAGAEEEDEEEDEEEGEEEDEEDGADDDEEDGENGIDDLPVKAKIKAVAAPVDDGEEEELAAGDDDEEE